MRDVCFDQMLDHRVAKVKVSHVLDVIGLRLVVELRSDLTRLDVIHALPAIRNAQIIMVAMESERVRMRVK